MNKNQYCNSLTSYSRWNSREVKIGDVSLGGNNPIRIQSMTTTDTMDTIGTVEQSIRMIDAGCEYIRITAPSRKQAENLSQIKKELVKRGYDTPLIADIHFTPYAAEIAARIVEKVRINPGNYADVKRFNYKEYSDKQYSEEINRIRKRFLPLISVCKEYGTAMRIGANHGSLSDRILSRYGDTPRGMVESAMEFLRICSDEKYYNVVISMKSSNPIVMVQAYRLLVNTMIKEKMNFPLHLGVTEAGEGEDGRIKSALGIGTLLEDGLGDTIRVSLTEEPEFEIPVARDIINKYLNRSNHPDINKINENSSNPFDYMKRNSVEILNIGRENVPRVINDLSFIKKIKIKSLVDLGYEYFEETDKWGISDIACDYIYIGEKEVDFKLPGTIGVIQDFSIWSNCKKNRHYPVLSLEQYLSDDKKHSEVNFLRISSLNLSDNIISKIKNDSTIVLVINSDNAHFMADIRSAVLNLINNNCRVPVIVEKLYSNLSDQQIQLYPSIDLGGLFIDGFGDGIMLKTEGHKNLRFINRISFGILQASRTRITKTEYISCPSCGRTLFDLQEVTSRIRSKTEHLKGLKIGIMGCIVNGPGEMADADYGYVGTGVGKISLYKKQDIVKKNVPMNVADEELIKLIKQNGDWVDP
ncbi:MAG: 4-hydroxy-3-methylbut-2-en-1-yl diphosphate synthase [Candidatus Marinimicrobia bacterium]|nr:4-hydroxy-3-methylbut-2-en-1-yl diphosphate synthase [Candidatus Neomarinimicrobiota bacterium]